MAKQYDIVLSYAQLDHGIANRLSSLLQERGVNVYYDKEAYVWGKNFVEHYNDILGAKGKYCVVLLSKNYANNNLSTIQRQIIQNQAFLRKSEYILPIRLDNHKITGFLESVACLKYPEKTETEIANLICEKLGITYITKSTQLLKSLFTGTKSVDIKFEMVSAAIFDSPFRTEVASLNQKILQLANFRDIKIVGCGVSPHRIQLHSSIENYECLRKLFLNKQLNKLTRIKWIELCASNPSLKLPVPKQSPIILSSQYDEANFDPNGSTVVCRAQLIHGHEQDKIKAESIIGKEQVGQISLCKVFITKSSEFYYIHSNYLNEGALSTTKIGTNVKVSLFTLFINLVSTQMPCESEMEMFQIAHKNHVKYFVDESIDDLDEAFYCGAMNVQFT